LQPLSPPTPVAHSTQHASDKATSAAMKLPGVMNRRQSSSSSLGSDDNDQSLPNLLTGEDRAPGLAPVSRDDFEVIELLGKGGFGEVKLVRHVHNGQKYAMKAVEKVELHERRNVGDAMAGSRAKVERDIGVTARQWRCPFIVELLATFQTDDKLYYIFEYCSRGELFWLVRSQPGGCIAETHARFFLAEICLALEHLHANNIVHRDLRLENVLIAEDGHVKLTDFGGAKVEFPSTGETRPSYVVEFGEGTTELFYPPEYWKGEPYGKDLDCWQLGIAMFSMLMGCLPEVPQDNKGPWPGNFNRNVSKVAADFCVRLLARQRDQRLGFPEGAGQLRGHGFFQGSPDFWKLAESKALSPPQLVADGPSRAKRSTRWARPTIPNWNASDLMRLSGFSYAASVIMRVSRSRSFRSSRGGWSCRSSDVASTSTGA